MDSLLPELQLLGNDHHREPDVGILKTLVETLYIILGKGGKEVRMEMKEVGAYLVVRELHLDIEDEGVRDACERIVDVLMNDEENGGASGKSSKQEEETRMIMESSDATGAQNLTTETKSSQDTSPSLEKEQSPQLAKSHSDPSSTTSIRNTNNEKNNDKDADEDDDDDNRIVEIF